MKKKHARRKKRKATSDKQRIPRDMEHRIARDTVQFDDGLVKSAIFIRKDQVDQLKAIKEDVGAPISVSIRKALDAYLAERKKNEELKN